VPGADLDTETTRALIRNIFDAYGKGDPSVLISVIHDDIDWVMHGPIEVFPFAGPRKGREAAIGALESIASLYELKRFVPEIILADGARAAHLSNVAFLQRTTGRMLTFKLVDFLRFENRMLVEFRELIDSFDVTQQALGRWLRV
jgi:ketosteroid isomerase-like protein